ncbi:MAG TPA: nucleotidyltransferase domain-containing protein [bacterium]|jgi:uncharacterized protein|nr:nucleotidyltransferase domain-containing protein [bacterium]MDX9805078.1 nucleotidyltransferase domain-containing protein [bacterium]HNZ53202.1 nucleotidyltransferase domain-containing protein [bacterium]HOG43379.1 nucleotidyltransferase domain-containing protein [bacterium]HPG37048.1 nucleotidyltransferase domain-containing protein [bacterium]
MVFNRSDVINILKSFKNKFAKKYGIISMGIFGSAARNELTNDSDIDIYVQTETPNPFVIIHMKDDLETILGRRVDIVRIREFMNKTLKNRIEKEGIYV